MDNNIHPYIFLYKFCFNIFIYKYKYIKKIKNFIHINK